jgi:hypothetical protein
MKQALTILLLLLSYPLSNFAQASDPDTTLLLHLNFDQNINGHSDETPTAFDNITYQEGIKNQAAFLGENSFIEYTAADNINPQTGTLEFWVKPSWDTETEDSYVLEFGGCGGILIFRNFGGFRTIFNRFACDGLPELGTDHNIQNWSPEQWYFVTVTWQEGLTQFYVNGELKASRSFDFELPLINNPTFRIGSATRTINAALDEFKIFGAPKTTEQIAATYLEGLSFESIQVKRKEITPQGDFLVPFDTLRLLESWWEKIYVEGQSVNGTVDIPFDALDWTLPDPDIAQLVQVNGESRIKAFQAGLTTVVGTTETDTVRFVLEVVPPVRPAEYETVDPYLADIQECALKEVPVVIIRYMPTLDGQHLDPANGGDINWAMPLDQLRDRIHTFDRRVKFMLTEGSKYHGYQDPEAIPYLGYKVVDVINVYEPLPKGKATGNNTNAYFPDYYQIVDRFNGAHYVNDLGVKEFWLWGWHNDDIVPAESNMSSPTSGDVSNSFRFQDDLPVYDQTYVLYNYNFGRSQNEAVHNHGHQIESQLGHVNLLQDNNLALFWGKFVGSKEDPDLDCSDPTKGCSDTNPFRKGRVGWTHMPPNTTDHYDYYNQDLFLSDIEDWKPDETGEEKMVHANTWGSIEYNWPDDNLNDIPGRTEAQWYIYWMQNIPGFQNNIPHGEQYITNWWSFFADWDASIENELGLYGEADTFVFPEFEADLSPISCAGLADGSIQLAEVSGAEGYDFSWDNGLTGDFLQNLTAGSYTATVSNEAFACLGILSYQIENPEPLELEAIIMDSIRCYGEKTGLVSIEVQGGTGAHHFLWASGDTTQLSPFLEAGIHTVTVTDDNDCSIEGAVELTQPEALSLSIVSSPEMMMNGNGTAHVEVQGGTPPYSYSWNDPANQNTPMAEQLASGEYRVQITDQNGCEEVGFVLVNRETILENLRHLDVSVYPNPASDIILIDAKLEPATSSTLTISDVNGKTLFFRKYEFQGPIREIVEVKNWPAGVYYVRVFSEEGTAVGKIVVQ